MLAARHRAPGLGVEGAAAALAVRNMVDGDFEADGGMSRIEDWHFTLGGKQRSLRNSRFGLRRSIARYSEPSRACQLAAVRLPSQSSSSCAAIARSHSALARSKSRSRN